MLRLTKTSLRKLSSGPQQSINHSLNIEALEVTVRLTRAHEHNRLASGVRHGDSCTNLTREKRKRVLKLINNLSSSIKENQNRGGVWKCVLN